jgi:hypothetical protein
MKIYQSKPSMVKDSLFGLTMFVFWFVQLFQTQEYSKRFEYLVFGLLFLFLVVGKFLIRLRLPLFKIEEKSVHYLGFFSKHLIDSFRYKKFFGTEYLYLHSGNRKFYVAVKSISPADLEVLTNSLDYNNGKTNGV